MSDTPAATKEEAMNEIRKPQVNGIKSSLVFVHEWGKDPELRTVGWDSNGFMTVTSIDLSRQDMERLADVLNTWLNTPATIDGYQPANG